jgi:hypothetical protein
MYFRQLHAVYPYWLLHIPLEFFPLVPQLFAEIWHTQQVSNGPTRKRLTGERPGDLGGHDTGPLRSIHFPGVLALNN